MLEVEEEEEEEEALKLCSPESWQRYYFPNILIELPSHRKKEKVPSC